VRLRPLAVHPRSKLELVKTMEITANPHPVPCGSVRSHVNRTLQYSPENQLDIIRQYAADHNMEIVQVYSDHGRSGLNIAGRDGLNRLMADVENKLVNFTSLLVYDVSRWGRFQDVDESAYYEYVLKRAGIHVHYCAERFENDGSMSSSVLKT
jgi:DNA invertase Pin-like site-specific DNA recombinase